MVQLNHHSAKSHTHARTVRNTNYLWKNSSYFAKLLVAPIDISIEKFILLCHFCVSLTLSFEWKHEQTNERQKPTSNRRETNPNCGNRVGKRQNCEWIGEIESESGKVEASKTPYKVRHIKANANVFTAKWISTTFWVRGKCVERHYDRMKNSTM